MFEAPTDNQIFDALCDVVTTPNITAFRANMVLLEHGVFGPTRALDTSAGLRIGIGAAGGAWQWGTLDQLEGALGL